MFRFQTQTSRDASGVGIRGGLRRSQLRVIRVSLAAYRLLPVYPYKQTSLPRIGMPQRCQQEIRAPQQAETLFDNRVSDCGQYVRSRNATNQYRQQYE
jgi:hypothetical protein